MKSPGLIFLLIISSVLWTHGKESSAINKLKERGGIISAAQSGGLSVEFHLRGRDLQDEGLEPAQELKDVRVLNLRDTKITSAGIKHIGGMENLRRLHLERTQVDDSCINYLPMNMYVMNSKQEIVNVKRESVVSKIKQKKSAPPSRS